MKILVVGGGGREHAIIRTLKKNADITEIFALPGNGGIAADATCVNISVSAKVTKFAFATICIRENFLTTLAKVILTIIVSKDIPEASVILPTPRVLLLTSASIIYVPWPYAS